MNAYNTHLVNQVIQFYHELGNCQVRGIKKEVKMRDRRKLNKKKIKAFYACVAAVGMISFTGSVASANNWKDSSFDFDFNGQCTEFTTEARTKEDASMSYVKCSSNNAKSLDICAMAKKGLKKGKVGDPFNYDYVTNTYTVKPGKYKYFTNNSRQYASTTFLCIGNCYPSNDYVSGVWSPDNCSGK